MILLRATTNPASLLILAVLCGCASQHQLAGSMQVTATYPVELRIESRASTNVQLQIWNGGPQAVHCQQVQPPTIATQFSLLTPGGRELSCAATTEQLEFVITVEHGEATVHYVVRSEQRVSMRIGSMLTP